MLRGANELFSLFGNNIFLALPFNKVELFHIRLRTVQRIINNKHRCSTSQLKHKVELEIIVQGEVLSTEKHETDLYQIDHP